MVERWRFVSCWLLTVMAALGQTTTGRTTDTPQKQTSLHKLDGWSKAKWGMSIEDISKLFASDGTVGLSKTIDQMYSESEIRSLRLTANTVVQATFIFREKRLSEVSLRNWRDPKLSKTSQGLGGNNHFDTIAMGLSTKYGLPTFWRDDSYDEERHVRIWCIDGGHIALTLLSPDKNGFRAVWDVVLNYYSDSCEVNDFPL